MTEKRKRKKITLRDQLASALADKLPEDERNRLRAAKVPADQIIKMFSPDHVVFHTWGGSDEWWNITMRLRPNHVEKTRKTDIKAIAKVRRRAKREAAPVEKSTGFRDVFDRDITRTTEKPKSRLQGGKLRSGRKLGNSKFKQKIGGGVVRRDTGEEVS